MKRVLSKRKWKAAFGIYSRIRFYFKFEYRNDVLSRETLICRCWYGTSAQENLQIFVSHKYRLNLKLWVMSSKTRRVRVCIRNVRTSCPEYPGLCLESPGIPWPTASFCGRRYKYRPYPFIQVTCHSVKLNSFASLSRALSLPFFHPWEISLRDSSESVARARFMLVSFYSISWALGFGQARGFQVCYSWSIELLDG